MAKVFIFMIISVLLWSSFAQGRPEDEIVSPISNRPESPLLAELENQVKGALCEYGFPNSLTDSFSFSGTVIICSPHALPKSREGVSQKYSCTVECDIEVLDKKSHALICKVKGTFDDIGRTPGTARKYALGKVVRPLFKCIKEKKRKDPKLQDMDEIFNTLEQEEAILKQHIESLSRFVDGIMNDMERSVDLRGAD